jgi:uncharacterized protein
VAGPYRPRRAREVPAPRATVRYAPPRRGPRAETVVGLLGALAALCVLTVVSAALFRGHGAELGGSANDLRPGTRQAALDSPLYRSGPLGRVDCRVPRIRAGDERSMLRFLTTLSDCLDRVWSGQFARARVAGFTVPQRVFWSMSGRSPCGSYPAPGASAFYCPVNDTMYVGLADIVDTAGGEPVSHYAVYARVIAHEYGHHVQEDAGILEYGHGLMASATRAADRDEVSRRVELQAQCLAGAFLSAERGTLPMTPAQYRAVLADGRARGDDRRPYGEPDHGTGRHYAGWVARGYDGRALASCNTWTAPSSEVS